MNEFDYLKDDLIKYRTNLYLPSNVTFGIEIEYEGVKKDIVDCGILDLIDFKKISKDWLSKTELDIYQYDIVGYVIGGEVSSPILTDNINDWMQIRRVLKLLRNSGGEISYKCGGHVNIGAHLLENNPEILRRLILLWYLYHEEIKKFSMGEYKSLRNNIAYFKPFNIDSNELLHEDIQLQHLNKQFVDKRHEFYLNKCNVIRKTEKSVIEFRIPNGTLSEEIWQNYINFFAKLILCCKKDLDLEYIVYKINNNEHSIAELADLVFDNDIDKEYFLIQTLKTNKVYKKEFNAHIV